MHEDRISGGVGVRNLDLQKYLFDGELFFFFYWPSGDLSLGVLRNICMRERVYFSNISARKIIPDVQIYKE